MKQIIVGGTLLGVALGGPYLMFETNALQELQRRLESVQSAPDDTTEQDSSGVPSTGWNTAPQSLQQKVPSSPSWFTSTGSPKANTSTPSPGGGVHPPSNAFPPAPSVPTQAVPNGYQSPNGPVQSASTPYQRPIQALQEVVRFDISPRWIIDRFPRVTAVSTETQLDGMEVSLKTGDTPTDLSGKLTYYFDPYKRVQRITMHAVSGDPARFLAELQHTYRLQYYPTLGGELFVKKWNGRPTSLVYTALAPVISAENLHSRYKLYAELNQPSLEFGISQEAQAIMEMVESKTR